MRQFFKENGRYVGKFLINQIIMSFLGLCVGLPTIVLNVVPVSIIGCVFTVAMLCFLQYDFAFHLGEKHCYLPVDQVKPKSSLGLKIALAGSVPTFVIILVGLSFRLLFESATVVPLLVYYGLNGTYVQLYALINAGISQMDNALLSGCIMWLFCLLFTAPGIISTSLGYYLGSKDKPLRTLFGIKVTKIEKTNR